MKTLFNAREREMEDWKELLQQADPRFRILDVHKPRIGTMGVIIVKWDGSN